MAVNADRIVFPLLLLVVVYLGGCAGPDGEPDDTGGARPSEPVNRDHLVVNVTGNQTLVVVPVSANLPTSADGNITYLGRAADGFTLLYVPASAPSDAFPIRGYFERPQYAQWKKQNTITGEDSIKCFEEEIAPGICSEKRGNTLGIEKVATEEFVLPSGHGFLLLMATTEGWIDVNLRFSASISLYEPQTLEGAFSKLGVENFDADYMDAVRCIDIAWCGVVLNGAYDLTPLRAYDFSWLDILAGGKAAYVHACLEHANAMPQCVEYDLVWAAASQRAWGTIYEVVASDDLYASMSLTAAAGEDGYFAFKGIFQSFNLPSHPGLV